MIISSFAQNATVLLVHGAWTDGFLLAQDHSVVAKKGLKVVRTDSPHLAHRGHRRSPTCARENSGLVALADMRMGAP